ncbi:MAG: CDP-alcohol phosphatidyltransferase family protein [Ruminococcaceae bacterium]|nr:CDP-alcohol phosphatidyltransferase family protein [Oscillospiraceae bacterium]
MFLKFKKEEIFTIPNILSFIRLLLIPAIVVAYVVYDYYVLAAILIVVSGITDIVDGKIARKYNLVSDFGKMLDPVADKLTQAAVLLCLVSRYDYIIYLFAIMAVKELFMGITGLVRIKMTGKVHGADWHGKLTTVLLYTTMVLHILWIEIPLIVSQILVVVCACVMILSMTLYGIANITSAKKGTTENNS